MEKLNYERIEKTKEKIELNDSEFMLIKALENLTETLESLKSRL